MGRFVRRSHQGSVTLWVVAAAAAGLLLGAGATYFVMSNNSDPEATADRGREVPQEPAGQKQERQKEQSELIDMELYRTARDGKKSIRCEYTQEGHQNVAFLRANGDIRISETTDEGTYYFINLLSTQDKAYRWQKGSTQGYSYNSETYGEHFEEDEYDIFEADTFERKFNAGEVTCEDVGTPDQQLFTKPDGVNFTMPTNQM